MFKNHKNAFKIAVAIITMILLISVLYLYINRTQKIAAISKVQSAMGYSYYPDKPGKVKDSIHIGGPSSTLKVPVELETKVKSKINGISQVTFIESWNSKDFKFSGSKDGIGNYFITFEVQGNKVTFIKSGGDLPPDMAK